MRDFGVKNNLGEIRFKVAIMLFFSATRKHINLKKVARPDNLAEWP